MNVNYQAVERILKMIESNKISAKDGNKLLSKLKSEVVVNNSDYVEMTQNVNQNISDNNSKVSEELFYNQTLNAKSDELSSQCLHRTVVLERPGTIDDIKICPIIPKEPEEEQIQILVKAFSMNFGDLLCVKGLYPTMPEYPFTPGFEVSGIVDKIGKSVKGIEVGDEVIGLVGTELGGHSTIININEKMVIRKPANITHEEACSFPVVFLTMFLAFEKANVKRGEKVLIQTAAGGTGLISVQLAKAKGAEIFATAGSDAKLNYLRDMGVDHLINYRTEKFEEKILEITDDYGVDVVINTLSGEAIQKGLDILAPGGRYVEIAMTGLKASGRINLSNLTNNQSIYSVDLRRFLLKEPELSQQYLGIMVRALENKEVIPTIGKKFQFSQIKEAYRYLENRDNIGKIVITVPDLQKETLKDIKKTSDDNLLAKSSIDHGHDTDIAIIGMSGRFPGARNLDEFWENIASGVSSIKEIPIERWSVDDYYEANNKSRNAHKTYSKWGGFLDDVDKFDPIFFNISGKEAELSDPQHRLFLEECWNALEDAGYARNSVYNSKCGVFVGAGSGDYQLRMYENGMGREAQAFWGNSAAILASRISYFLNLKGPAVTLDAACSSSLVAIHLGCQSIISGETDMVIAGGVYIAVTPDFYVKSSNASMLSPDGRCNTFDNSANGIVYGEGVGVVILKSLKAALRDRDNIYGIIKGSAINQDGKTNGITAPSTVSQTQLELEVYNKFNINPETISYIEAHGTATKLGDPIEIEALTNSFNKFTDKKGFCSIGSVKTNIGHTVAAAGIAGVIKVLLSLKHGKIPPTLNFIKSNEYINFEDSPFFVNTELREWGSRQNYKRRAAISSFGFSGTNAHMVIEEAPKAVEVYKQTNDIPYYIITLSAKTELALEQKVVDLISWLDNNSSSHSLGEICYTLNIGRSHFNVRLAFIVEDVEDLKKKLELIKNKRRFDGYYYNKLKEDLGILDSSLRSLGIDALNEIAYSGDYDYEIYKNKLLLLADIYTKGYEMQWDLLYRNSKIGFISMPTYPFSRKTFWIQRHAPKSYKPQIKPYYLVDGPDLEIGLKEKCIAFRKVLHRTEPVIRDHIIRGELILPGVAHLEIVYEALDQIKHFNKATISNVVWLVPILMSSETKEITIFIKEESGEMTFEIQSQSDGSMVIHSKGHITIDENHNDRKLLIIEEIKSRCVMDEAEDKPYIYLINRGIQYGTFYQGLEQLWKGENEALGYIRLLEEHRWNFDSYILHPTILDAALQTTIGIYKDEDGTTLLPFSISRIEVLARIERNSYAYVTGIENLPLHCNVTITNESGLICVKLYDVAFRKMKDTKEKFFYIPTWKETYNLQDRPESSIGNKVIIASKNSNLSLREDITKQYLPESVYSIILGNRNVKCSEYEWEIDASDSSNYQEHINKIANIDTIYYLAGVYEAAINPDNLMLVQEYAHMEILQLFRLIKSLYKCEYATKAVNLKIVTNDVWNLYESESGDIEHINPCNSGLHGMAKSLANENVHWKVSCIDISMYDSAESDEITSEASYIFKEQQNIFNGEVLIRGNKRFVRSIKHVALPQINDIAFKQSGVYLIIGGMGGIGLVLSRYLSKEFNSNIILLGRSNLNNKMKEKIKEIESLGGKVIYIEADATCYDSMKTAVNKAKSYFGRIDGVIHSAAVLNDRMIQNMDEEELLKALNPKIIGSINLYRAIQNEKLDFLMFFSSLASITGNVGQINYAAACSFKDSFARSLAQIKDYPVKVINWGYWGNVGIAAIENSKLLSERGLLAIEESKGIEAINRILKYKASQVIALKAEERTLKQIGVEFTDEASMNYRTSFSPNSQSKEVVGDNIKIKHQTDVSYTLNEEDEAVKKRDYIRELVLDKIASILRVSKDELDENAPFTDFGVDSILAVDIISILNKTDGIILNSTDLFNYPNISKLSDYINSKFSEKIDDLCKIININQQGVKNPDTVEYSHKQVYAKLTDEASIKKMSTHLSEEMNQQRKSFEHIAIIGMSCRFPEAENADDFWDNLYNGKDSVKEITRWKQENYYHPDPQKENKSYSKWAGLLSEIDKFDPGFFNISPKEAEYMDPQQRIFIEEAWRAIEDAGYDPSNMGVEKCGVFVGCAPGDYKSLLKDQNVSQDAYTLLGNSESILTARISYFLNLTGPNIAVNTACSSSLVAIHLACESIIRGTSDMAIAGGVCVLSTPEFHILASKSSMLSTDGRCKTFDNGANGFVPGEGAGVLVLKKLSDAIRDHDNIYGIINGSDINQDGKTNGITAPSAPSQTKLECSVYDKYKISPESISYIEAHGTGTKLGDPIEIQALNDSFSKYTHKKQFCAIGSVKSNIGHLLAASGVAGVIKILLCLKHKKLVPSLHLEKDNEYIDFKNSPFFTNKDNREWSVENGVPRRAAVSSFGFSGTNAHLVLSEANIYYNNESSKIKPKYLITLSAVTEAALRRKYEEMYIWIKKKGSEYCIRDISYTINAGRTHFQVKAAIIVSDINELEMSLKSIIEGRKTDNCFINENGALKLDNATRIKGIQVLEQLIGVSDDLYSNKLSELAQLYTRGYVPEWKKLYENEECCHIPMPTYPFEKESYWVNDYSKELEVENITLRLHPLISSNVSTLKEERFLARFTGDEFIFTDHVVFKEKIMPAAAYIEMARASAEIAGEQNVCKIKNISFAKPIRLVNLQKPSEPLEIYIELQPSNSNSVNFTISTQDNYGKKQIHSEGIAEYSDKENSSYISELEVQSILNRCMDIVDDKWCYAMFKKIGMNYGVGFKAIKEVHQGLGEVIAHVEMPTLESECSKNYILHPSIIDAALQTVIVLMGGKDETTGKTYLPFSMDEIKIYDSTCEAYWIYTTNSSTDLSNLTFVKSDISIADQSGKILVEIKGFSVRAYNGQAPIIDKDSELSDLTLINLLKEVECGNISIEEAERMMKKLH